MGASKWLQLFSKAHPGVWRRIDDVRARGRARWAPWCYVPEVEIEGIFAKDGMIDSRLGMECPLLAVLAAWRHTQGVYRFSPDLLDAVLATPISRIPVEALHRLPEWAVYVELPHYEVKGHRVQGMFFALDDDPREGFSDVLLLLDPDEGPLLPVVLPLVGESLDEAVAARDARILADADSTGDDRRRALARIAIGLQPTASDIAPLLSVALYLCAETDIRDQAGDRERPSHPVPKRVKGGERLFPPDRPTVWECGFRIGAKLRAARAATIEHVGEGTHAAPRPHVRRAHWHAYRVGHGRTDVRVKWLHPILVGVRDDVDAGGIVPTIRQVD